jgi:hypothetical protein
MALYAQRLSNDNFRVTHYKDLATRSPVMQSLDGTTAEHIGPEYYIGVDALASQTAATITVFGADGYGRATRGVSKPNGKNILESAEGSAQWWLIQDSIQVPSWHTEYLVLMTSARCNDGPRKSYANTGNLGSGFTAASGPGVSAYPVQNGAGYPGTIGPGPNGPGLNGRGPDGLIPIGPVPNGPGPNGRGPDGLIPIGQVSNGPRPSGPVPNGLGPNGIRPNGPVPGVLGSNGLGPNGPVPGVLGPNGLGSNGVRPNGPVPGGLGPNGMRPNGPFPGGPGPNGMGLNGPGLGGLGSNGLGLGGLLPSGLGLGGLGGGGFGGGGLSPSGLGLGGLGSNGLGRPGNTGPRVPNLNGLRPVGSRPIGSGPRVSPPRGSPPRGSPPRGSPPRGSPPRGSPPRGSGSGGSGPGGPGPGGSGPKGSGSGGSKPKGSGQGGGSGTKKPGIDDPDELGLDGDECSSLNDPTSDSDEETRPCSSKTDKEGDDEQRKGPLGDSEDDPLLKNSDKDNPDQLPLSDLDGETAKESLGGLGIGEESIDGDLSRLILLDDSDSRPQNSGDDVDGRPLIDGGNTEQMDAGENIFQQPEPGEDTPTDNGFAQLGGFDTDAAPAESFDSGIGDSSFGGDSGGGFDLGFGGGDGGGDSGGGFDLGFGGGDGGGDEKKSRLV